MDVYEAAEQFRADILSGERRAASALVRAYGQSWTRVRARLDALQAEIAAARARGETVDPTWLLERRRLARLQAEIEGELRRFAELADETIRAEQERAIAAALDHAEQLVLAGLGDDAAEVAASVARLPREAVVDLVGRLQDGSPLADLLAEAAHETARQAADALVVGLATGQGPGTIAMRLRELLGGDLVRALRIARTEVLRAYRETSRRAYRANADIISGWRWLAALTDRTCAYCWAQHGSVHPLDEPMATHPNCRCAMVPVLRGRPAVGAGPTGPEAFAALPEPTQRAILGGAKLAAYQAGQLQLTDLIGERRDPRWGPVGYERSLRELGLA